MSDLARTVLDRHSTRKFLPRPVPRDLVNEALALAQHAPSNSNIQPVAPGIRHRGRPRSPEAGPL